MNPTVYLIDDEEVICQSVKFVLEQGGFKVQCYASAEAFLDVCGPSMWGCVLTDIRMPSMNGLMLQDELTLRQIRLPVIFMTGYADVDVAVQAIKKGALDFLEKPMDPDTLIECVGNALAQDMRRREKELGERELIGRVAKLTPREREVLICVAGGDTNKQAAKKLGLSHRTVEKYRISATKKLKIACAMDLSEIAKLLASSD